MSSEGNQDIERRVGILEDKDRYNDKRLRNIERTMKEDRKEINESIEKLHNSLKEIEKGQHTQEITNVKMNYTLDSINREREIERENKEESRKEFKQLRWLILGTIFTLLSSLILAAIRSWLGI
ncbi:DUF2951 family protein [Staphylococcus ureilyticus]|uniref:DUF2951 domain-containing protein n=1 Tax=Staphylococcus virus IME1354_01 TaxID=3070820 RepID=A0A1W6JQ91_9CAUD|nr:hypothetical protein PP279_gp62 [Staphylococcus virus IME1354_01]ARM68394.1 hypothetical protein [Staphylococcus virus IME1354_01]MDW4222077.1 DUF2951 family protein [Staphylococcus saprophyticus]